MRDELNALVHSVRRRFFLSPKVMDFMPAVPEMQRTLERGRYLYDGYQRSSSLKYGSLGDLVTRDPIYRKARAASRLPGVRSVVDEERFHNLFLIIKFFMRDLKSQNVIEFGAYKGGSAIFWPPFWRNTILLPECCLWTRLLEFLNPKKASIHLLRILPRRI